MHTRIFFLLLLLLLLSPILLFLPVLFDFINLIGLEKRLRSGFLFLFYFYDYLVVYSLLWIKKFCFTYYTLWSPSISIWRNPLKDEFKDFIVEPFFYPRLFFQVHIGIRRDSNTTLSLEWISRYFFFSFFPFLASKSSYLKNKFIERIPFASLFWYFLFFFFLKAIPSYLTLLLTHAFNLLFREGRRERMKEGKWNASGKKLKLFYSRNKHWSNSFIFDTWIKRWLVQRK